MRSRSLERQYALFDSHTDGAIGRISGQQRAVSRIAGQSDRLWLCLLFAELPLEVSPGARHEPRAVLAEQSSRARILMCNAAADRLGVLAGLSVNAALALAPKLELVSRDRRRETETLKKIAAWALRYTPTTSIDATNALLLEVRASLRLFGGLVALRKSLLDGLAERGHRARHACAPTALGALWLARADAGTEILDSAGLAARLGRLPLQSLNWPQKTQQMLLDMGIRTIGECIRLPRGGLARRIGPAKLAELDRGLGRRPEVRILQAPLERFAETIDLPVETAANGLLMQGAHILLERLEVFLSRHQRGVQNAWIRLRHHSQPDTLLRIGLLQPTCNTASLAELIGIRFADIQIRSVVSAIGLQTDLVDRSLAHERDLLGYVPADDSSTLNLLERLRVRLGFNAVHGLSLIAEHRPESAWRVVSEPHPGAQTAISDGALGNRPAWMLETPLSLEVVTGRPVFDGVLSLEKGPERIETGWWDGRDVRRDYYVAGGRQGVRLWIFRELRESRWFLHGIFG